jgi:hypothetical protein
MNHQMQQQIKAIEPYINRFTQLTSGKQNASVIKELDELCAILNQFEKYWELPSLTHSHALTLKMHGSYDSLDQFKHDVPMYEALLSNSLHPVIEAKIKNLKKRELHRLPVDVIMISAAPINFTVFTKASENEKYLPFIKQLHYNGVLEPLNQEKQLLYITDQLRNIYINELKKDNVGSNEYLESLKKQLKSHKENPHTPQYEEILSSIESVKRAIKKKQNTIKHAYQHFNIHHFKKGDITEKFLQEIPRGLKPGMGIISGLEQEELFSKYAEKYKDDPSKVDSSTVFEGSGFICISLDNFIYDMYESMKIKPDYFIIVDFTCNPLENNEMPLNKDNAAERVKQFHKRTHVGKRSFVLSGSTSLMRPTSRRSTKKIRSLPKNFKQYSLHVLDKHSRTPSRRSAAVSRNNYSLNETTHPVSKFKIKPEYIEYTTFAIADIGGEFNTIDLKNYDLNTLYKSKNTLFFKNMDPTKEPLVIISSENKKYKNDITKIHLTPEQEGYVFGMYSLPSEGL